MWSWALFGTGPSKTNSSSLHSTWAFPSSPKRLRHVYFFHRTMSTPGYLTRPLNCPDIHQATISVSHYLSWGTSPTMGQIRDDRLQKRSGTTLLRLKGASRYQRTSKQAQTSIQNGQAPTVFVFPFFFLHMCFWSCEATVYKTLTSLTGIQGNKWPVTWAPLPPSL